MLGLPGIERLVPQRSRILSTGGDSLTLSAPAVAVNADRKLLFAESSVE